MYGDHYPRCTIHIDAVFEDLIAVQFMSAGSLYFQRGGHPRREWRQPAFFWTDITDHYSYGPGGTGSWNHYWFNFKGQGARAHILPLLEDLAPEGILPVPYAKQVENQMTHLIRQVRNPPRHPAETIHHLHRLLDSVHQGKPDSPEADPRIRHVQDLINASPERDWDFHRLARAQGMSYSQFRRRFREHTGQPPARYLTSRRIREAADRLASSTSSIQEIGEQVGYPEPAHFSKAFKHQLGVSPRAYRRNLFQHTF